MQDKPSGDTPQDQAFLDAFDERTKDALEALLSNLAGLKGISSGERMATALEELIINLIRFAGEYQKDPHTGASDALAACCRFLRKLGLPKPVLRPLDELLQAYHDLGRGCVVPLLEPPRLQARPPLPTSEKIQRAVAAAAVELEYRHLRAKGIENPLPHACSTVATLLNQKLGLRRRQGPVFEPNTLKLWRSKVRDRNLQTLNNPRDISAVEHFEHILKDPTLTAKRLIQSLPLTELPTPPDNP